MLHKIMLTHTHGYRVFARLCRRLVETDSEVGWRRYWHMRTVIYLCGAASVPNMLYRFCNQVIVLTLQLNRCVTSLRLTSRSNNQMVWF